jgi:hypothetical protein
MNTQHRHIYNAALGHIHNIITNMNILGNNMKIAPTKKIWNAIYF